MFKVQLTPLDSNESIPLDSNDEQFIVLNSEQLNSKKENNGNGGNDENDENESSEEDEVEEIFKELEPDQYTIYLQSQPRQNIKEALDEKIVLPFLMGAFVNGELDVEMCKKLGDTHSRRKLFRKFL
jgi:calcineurin-like phosphoesterase family protein